jgi:hypothetical protein
MPPLKKIPTSYARFLAKNYQDLKRSPQRLIPLESKAVWFDKETYLQALGLNPQTDTGIITGIRLYFGSYRNNDPRPDKREKLTLILVPTRLEGNKHVDILDDPNADPADIPDEQKDEYNDGQLCPPSCDNYGLLNHDHQ